MNDREILRPLAEKAAQLSRHPSQKERAGRFRALNSRKLVQPVVLIDELPWNQLDADGFLALQCENPVLRQVERSLRRTIFQWENFQGDMLVSPHYDLPRRIGALSLLPPVVEDILSADQGNTIVSHHFIDQMADEKSLDLIRTPEIQEDKAGSDRDFDLVASAIGDIYPVRQVAYVGAGYFKPWDDLSFVRGVEPILMDLADRPEYLLSIMEKFTQCSLELLSQMEEKNLIDPEPAAYIHCTAGLCDDLPKVEGRPANRGDIWGRGTAQMFSAVSPRMHDEFEIEFAKRFFAGFRRVYYGCCEPLHKKIEIVRKIPNVTKISITPWADVDEAADKMGGDFVMAWKPNPASLAVPVLNEDALRKEVSHALAACRRNHTPMEITLKDISSIHYNLNNLRRWTQIVMEMVAQ